VVKGEIFKPNLLTSGDLAAIFEYRNGCLFWKKAPSKRIRAGSRAGTLRPTGYRQICVNGKKYLEHRLIWCLLKGEWPSFEIDHINRQKDDNRIENLRDIKHEYNCLNRRTSDKAKGIYFDKNKNKYRARIKIKNKLKMLGCYTTKEEAEKAYKLAKEQYCAIVLNKM
jgi:hypothetical protein